MSKGNNVVRNDLSEHQQAYEYEPQHLHVPMQFAAGTTEARQFMGQVMWKVTSREVYPRVTRLPIHKTDNL